MICVAARSVHRTGKKKHLVHAMVVDTNGRMSFSMPGYRDNTLREPRNWFYYYSQR